MVVSAHWSLLERPALLSGGNKYARPGARWYLDSGYLVFLIIKATWKERKKLETFSVVYLDSKVSAATAQNKANCYFLFIWEKVSILNLRTGAQQIDSNSSIEDTQINQKPLYWVILQAQKWLDSHSESLLPGNCLRVIWRMEMNIQKKNENIFQYEKTQKCIVWLGNIRWCNCHLGCIWCIGATNQSDLQIVFTY